MAKARMLHKSISTSIQVNNLRLPSQLLFTWMIAHADDEGKLKGSPVYIKAIVIPMKNWAVKRIKQYLIEIKDAGLINYWEKNNEWYIEFVKWERYQQIRKDRFVPSNLPSFFAKDNNQSSTFSQPNNAMSAAQSNSIKSNEMEINTKKDPFENGMEKLEKVLIEKGARNEA